VSDVLVDQTKDIILNLETAADRRARDDGDLKRAIKPYGRLKTKQGVDLLVRLDPLSSPNAGPCQIVPLSLG
jgi:hypothetical protein